MIGTRNDDIKSTVKIKDFFLMIDCLRLPTPPPPGFLVNPV